MTFHRKHREGQKSSYALRVRRQSKIQRATRLIQNQSRTDNIATQNQVTIVLVPVHRGIEGEERTVALTKDASAANSMEPEPVSGTLKALVCIVINKWSRKQLYSYWKSVPKHQDSLRKHLHKIRMFKNEPICRLFLEQEVSASHVMFDCKVLRR